MASAGEMAAVGDQLGAGDKLASSLASSATAPEISLTCARRPSGVSGTTLLRRRAQFGLQLPMLLAGGVSVSFGIAYVIASGGTDPMLSMLAIYAAGAPRRRDRLAPRSAS